jgi:hypothetical protein
MHTRLASTTWSMPSAPALRRQSPGDPCSAVPACILNVAVQCCQPHLLLLQVNLTLLLVLLLCVQEREAEHQQRHPTGHWPETSYVLADEECLPLAEGSADCELTASDPWSVLSFGLATLTYTHTDQQSMLCCGFP